MLILLKEIKKSINKQPVNYEILNERSIHHFFEDQNDAQLWDLFRGGDRDAFELIYHKFVKQLYNYGMTFVPDAILVKESIQDLFVEIWANRERLGNTDNIKFYLMRSLRRKIAKTQSNSKRWESTSSTSTKLSQIMSKRSLAEFTSRAGLTEKEIAQKLSEAISDLPARQREALYHIYYENLSYEEAASMMNVNVKTVYNLAWRGVESLRKTLSRANFFYLSPALIAAAVECSVEMMEISQ